MNEIQIFNKKEFGSIRSLNINNKPYLCLVDVCKILDISNPSQLKNRLDQDGLCTNEVIDNMGRYQVATFINESNLYKIIFQSRKAEAEKFTKWVTNEVLPAIRRTGGYISGEEELSEEELISKAMQVLNKKVEVLKFENQEKAKMLEAQKPKVKFANSVINTKNCISVNDLAKILNQNGYDIGQNRLFEWLREYGYLINRSKNSSDYNMPTQKAMDLGLFYIKETVITKPNGTTFVSKTPLVTGKGQVYLFNKYVECQNKK